MGDTGPQPRRDGGGGAAGTEPGRRSPPPPAGTLVFAGSGPADVAAARAFWSSAALPPPLESRLGPAAPCRRNTALQGPPLVRKSERESIFEAHNVQKAEENEKYFQQSSRDWLTQGCTVKAKVGCTSQMKRAKKREEILALLRKQREERIAKELISHPYKPKTKTDQLRGKVSDSDLMDQEAVKALK